jgi:hypothetical protein
MEKLSINGTWFREIQHGRRVLLRGINLGGDTKVPFPNGGTQYPDDFQNHTDVSFIGRPFPLEEAEEHFLRLKNWGFNCLRLLTTWEAVEHFGPKQYDIAYLDYFTSIVELAGKFGFYVFIDFHQDVWSRMTGGDGAPAWTLEKIGIDISKISESDSALVMQSKYDYSRTGIRQEENYPTMSWSQNYRYPANAIMWTLFFAGRDFAPKFNICGQNVQDFLQSHYLGCIQEIAHRIKDFDHALGFDSLNEPSRGWIGSKMNDRGLNPDQKSANLPGLAWSAIDGLFTSNGYTIELPFMELSILKAGFTRKEDRVINPNKISLWQNPDLGDPFQIEGAWELKDDMPFVLNNDYFCKIGEHEVNFDNDYMIPFIHKVSDAITNIRQDWIIFAEKEALGIGESHSFKKPLPQNTVNASHWYDLPTLVFKRFNYPITVDPFAKKLVFGRKGIEEMYKSQMNKIKSASSEHKVPTLLGEFGIPFDLQEGKAYKKWKNGNREAKIWKQHNLALDMMYNSIDALQIHSTLWNYTAGNRNDLMIGDQWNQEDLSIFSSDQIDDSLFNKRLNPFGYGSGGRAIEGFSRPYPRFTAGEPLLYKFDSKKKEFTFEYRCSSDDLGIPTEVFIPKIHYPNGIKVIVESGYLDYSIQENNIKLISHEIGFCKIRVIPD